MGIRRIQLIYSFIHNKDLFSAFSRGTAQKCSQRRTQIGVVEAMVASRFWEVIGEPIGDCSRMRNQAPRTNDSVWWRCGQKELEGDLAQPSKLSKFNTTVFGGIVLLSKFGIARMREHRWRCAVEHGGLAHITRGLKPVLCALQVIPHNNYGQ